MTTIQSLLEEGERLLRAREAVRGAERVRERSAALESWKELLEAATRHLGPLACLLSGEMPEDFSINEKRRFVFVLQPFGKAPLQAGFGFGNGEWQPHTPVAGGHANLTGKWLGYPIRCEPYHTEDEGEQPCYRLYDYTDSLPEALAMVKRAEGLWAEVQAECDRRNAERTLRQSQYAAARKPSDPGQMLLNALVNYLEWERASREEEDDRS